MGGCAMATVCYKGIGKTTTQRENNSQQAPHRHKRHLGQCTQGQA